MEELFLKKLNLKAPSGVRFSKNPDKKDTKRTYRVEKIYEWEKFL
jgi:hypothetical protein